jgi:hypothetical protein
MKSHDNMQSHRNKGRDFNGLKVTTRRYYPFAPAAAVKSFAMGRLGITHSKPVPSLGSRTRFALYPLAEDRWAPRATRNGERYRC